LVANRGAAATIERMVEADLDQVLPLERAAFRTPWSRETFRSALTQGHVRCSVARRGRRARRVAGYTVQQQIGCEVDLLRLVVDPDLRRRGVGRLLLDAVLEDARRRGVARVSLKVRVVNAAARALYGRLGFQATGPHTYPDAAPGPEMSVTIEPARAAVPTPSTGGAA
jgi:ribosomal-protein-alanine N-acetyltransferase